VQAEVPASVAELDRMVRLLDEYVAMHTPSAARSTSEADAMGRGAAGAEARAVESKIDWLALRSSTPTPSVRGGAEAGLMFFGPWKSPVLKVAEQDAVQSLELKRDEPDAQQKMVLARDVNGAAAIYLERMEPAAMYDSGWYIGPADAPPAGVEVIVLSVADVLAMRPDLAKVLALPQGVLLGIDAKGLAAIYDPDDADLFAPLSEQVTIARESEREDQAAAE
jgi:hypothetical protein